MQLLWHIFLYIWTSQNQLIGLPNTDGYLNTAILLSTKLFIHSFLLQLSFRSAQKSLLDVRAKLRELLHIPRVLQSGQPLLCHAARDLEEEVGLYLRKTVEKHDLSRNYNVSTFASFYIN